MGSNSPEQLIRRKQLQRAQSRMNSYTNSPIGGNDKYRPIRAGGANKESDLILILLLFKKLIHSTTSYTKYSINLYLE